MSDDRIKRIAYEFQHGKPTGVRYNVSVNVSLEELDRLSPEQCAAFMRGIASVLSANPHSKTSRAASTSEGGGE